MSFSAIILARGGSRGVPRKNLVDVGGITLLARAIRTAQRVTPDVWVSTEDGMIAPEAISHGANVINRPHMLAQDDTPGIEALRHAVEQIDAETVALVQCTAPLLAPSDIRNCVDALDRGFDLAVACVPFHGVVLSGAGRHLTFDPAGSTNRQERRCNWLVAGSVWAFRREYVQREWWSGSVACVPAERSTYLEIDTPEDLEHARMAISRLEPPRTGRARGVLCEVAGSYDGDVQRGDQTSFPP